MKLFKLEFKLFLKWKKLKDLCLKMSLKEPALLDKIKEEDELSLQ